MSIDMPAFVRKCIALLEAHGHCAYIVGGCVRDSLRGRAPGDWDICTSALPEQMQEAFAGEVRTIPTGLQHGTLTLHDEHTPVEATTFRRDGVYLDHRRPQSVDFTASLREDLARRDFTVNAIAYSERGGLQDFFGGQADLAAGTLRCVGDPATRFGEDALRILRLFRFMAQLGFTPHPATLAGAREQKGLLGAVSAERISAELSKLIMGGAAHSALSAATGSGVLTEVIPEFAPAIGFDQRSPYHDRTVDEHSFAALSGAPARHDIRLALLLHDIGKPQVATFDGDGKGHYKGHAGAGARLAQGILARLRYPGKTAANVLQLIAFHNKHIPAEIVEMRRFLGRWGLEFTHQLLDVKMADNRAKSASCTSRLAHYESVRMLVNNIAASGTPLTISGLAINGDDLISAGFLPGPEIGRVLRVLLETVLRQPEKNTREHLLEIAAQRTET